ncbi:MAG TPA: ATP-dependent metallopeptidase FtsH/Yme1/Tma family protein, partial [bacterium]|nr:ATP-dependent metallopeptidase FtsH/Yme1/Tma family protein [bacterium]
MERKHVISIWYFVIALLILMFVQTWLEARRTETISYSEFKLLLDAKKLNDIAIGDGVISGTFSVKGLDKVLPAERLKDLKLPAEGEVPFVTVSVNDPQLVPDLEKSGVAFHGVVQHKWISTLLSWVLPAVIFVGLWFFLMQR